MGKGKKLRDQREDIKRDWEKSKETFEAQVQIKPKIIILSYNFAPFK